MTFDRDRFHVLNVFSERVTSGDVGLTRQENISVASGGAPCQRISSNQSRDNNQRGRGTNQPQHAIKKSANPRDQQDRPPEAQKPGIRRATDPSRPCWQPTSASEPNASTTTNKSQEQ